MASIKFCFWEGKITVTRSTRQPGELVGRGVNEGEKRAGAKVKSEGKKG